MSEGRSQDFEMRLNLKSSSLALSLAKASLATTPVRIVYPCQSLNIDHP